MALLDVFLSSDEDSEWVPGPRRLRQLLALVIIVLLWVVAARLVILDLAGALVLFGALNTVACAAREGASPMWAFLSGIALLVDGALNAAAVVEWILRARVPLVGKSLPWYVNIVHLLLITGPVFEGIGAAIAFQLQIELMSQSAMWFSDTLEASETREYGTFETRPSPLPIKHFQGRSYKLKAEA